MHEPKDRSVTGKQSQIFEHFQSLGIPNKTVRAWWSLGKSEPRNAKTLDKIISNLPKQEEMDHWRALTATGKTLETLQKIKYPLLVGWTFQEILHALKPYIFKHVKKFKTYRCDVEECFQNASIGLIKALRTDAGISPFASHAFKHLKTNVRRPSATAGVIKRPERKPSRTDVRRAITQWALGEAYHMERDKLLAQKKDKAEIDRTLAVFGFNKNKLVSQDELVKYKVQRIGKPKLDEDGKKIEKPEFEMHLSEGMLLSRFDITKLLDLFDFLDYRFSTERGDPTHVHTSYFANVDSSQLRTVGDVVGLVAESPDFHGNPKPMTGETDDGASLGETIINSSSPNPVVVAAQNERVGNAKRLIQKIQNALDLSEAQHIVLRHWFGLDGYDPLNGAEIASRFGELAGEKPIRKGVYRSVSRQRITQHQRAIQKKIVEVTFEIIYIEGQKREELEAAVMKADLSVIERRLFCHRYGLRGAPQRDIAYLAANYEEITGETLPKGLDKSGRETLIGNLVHESKIKLVGTTLGVRG